MIRQQVPDHRTCHGECPTSEPTATMTWYDQLMASGRSETLTTGNVWCRNAAVDTVAPCLVSTGGPSLPIYTGRVLSAGTDPGSWRMWLTVCLTSTSSLAVRNKKLRNINIQGGSKKVSCWHSTTAYFFWTTLYMNEYYKYPITSITAKPRHRCDA